MKIGENPQLGESYSSIPIARIFLVIYIPNFSGFFSNMETILKLSLDSLERTVDPNLGRVTLVSNGCCPDIEKLILDRRSVVFDQVVINGTNRGKTDGLLSAARGSLEEIIVASDCDMLFQPHWLEETVRIFSDFPEAASVTPISSPRQYVNSSVTTLIGSALKRELSIKQRMPPEDFERLIAGSAEPNLHLRFRHGQATVSRNGLDAGIAGSHQCVAFRREMFLKLPSKPSLALLDPLADKNYLDHPPDFHGYWKLSTPRTMVFHMGNTPDKWMFEQNQTKELPKDLRLPLPPLRKPFVGRLPFGVRKKMAFPVKKYLAYKFDKRNIQDKGLSPNSPVIPTSLEQQTPSIDENSGGFIT